MVFKLRARIKKKSLKPETFRLAQPNFISRWERKIIDNENMLEKTKLTKSINKYYKNNLTWIESDYLLNVGLSSFIKSIS